MKPKNDALLNWRRQVASSTPPITNQHSTRDPMNKVHFAEIEESIRNGVDDDDDYDDNDEDYEYPPSNTSYYNYNGGDGSVGRDHPFSELSSSFKPVRNHYNHHRINPYQNGVNLTQNNLNNTNNININNSISSRNNHSTPSNNNMGGGLLPKVNCIWAAFHAQRLAFLHVVSNLAV